MKLPMLAFWIGIGATFLLAAHAGAEPVPSEVPPDMQAEMDARGLSTEASLEVAPDPGKSNAWHAKLFAAIRGCSNAPGDRCVWAWVKCHVTQWGGAFRERHCYKDKGSPGWSWQNGPFKGEWYADYTGIPHKELLSIYQTDWSLGRCGSVCSRWTATLKMRMTIAHKVHRRVKWSHGA